MLPALARPCGVPAAPAGAGRAASLAASRSAAGLAIALLAVAIAGCATSAGPEGSRPATETAAMANAATATARAPVEVKVLAINDFHGHLKPPPGGLRLRDPADPSKFIDIPAGGAAHLATALRELKARNPNHVFVAAGDLVGASPLLSALLHDEPTIDALGLMGLEIAAVGNHEFDRGSAELLRLQHGGCHPVQGCTGRGPFTGARFQYLAASTVDERTGATLLPPYRVKRFEGIPVAFIGLTLKGTPQIVQPSGVAGLRFLDEAQTVNALVPGLRAQGIEAIVVLIHEGGLPTGGPNECPSISGPIVDIVGRLDPAVDVVVTGHTHRSYACRLGGRLVTSADPYGTMLTDIDLTLDPSTGDVTAARANNLIVRTDTYAPDAAQTALIAATEPWSAPRARRVVGRLAAPLPRDPGADGESPLGQVVADAQLAATTEAGAQLALMNPGGLRTALRPGPDGLVRYEDLFAAQPFYNPLVTMTLTGRQIHQALEAQWLNQPRPRILQVSAGFGYTWDASQPPGRRVPFDGIRLHGQPLQPDGRYRVTVNGYLAEGGDNFAVFTQGSDRRTGVMDVDALDAYLAAHAELPATRPARIRRAE